jgi:hypothetical protein
MFTAFSSTLMSSTHPKAGVPKDSQPFLAIKIWFQKAGYEISSNHLPNFDFTLVD